MATKTLYLNSTGTSVITNTSCSYEATTITTDNLTSKASATLQWLFYLSDICGSENVTINSIKVSYKASSNRNSSFYTEGTARTGYLIQSGSDIANSSNYTDKTIERDKTGNTGVGVGTYTDAGATFDSSYTSWSSSHLITHNGKKAAGIFISLINNYTVNFIFDIKDLAIVVDYTEHTHSYTSTVTKAATCTATGVRTYTCSCGDSYTEAISALGHSFGTTTAAKAATCIRAGNSAYKKCSRCNLYFAGSAATNATGGKSDTSSFVIAAKGHSWGATTYSWATDGHTCTAERTCNICGTIELSTGTITSAVKTAATCTVKGTTTYTAKFSESWATTQTKDVQDIAATGHSYGSPTYSWSADGKSCTATRVCSKDSSHKETATATITSAVKTAATCTTKGTTTYTAKFSVSWATTQTKDVQDIAAKGHTEVKIPAVAATCTATGLTEGKKCSVCNTILVAQQTVAALGHDYSKVDVIQPTATSHGYTRHTCTRCGHYYDDSYTYLVRWYNEDGSKLLETDSAVPYGDMPTYNGATPTKTATAQYTYTHIGWAVSPTAENTTGLTAVVANIDYYARFRADINKYTVTWKNDDGTVLETDTLVPYGDPPDYNGKTPTKSSTAQYDYTFLGWSAKVNDPPLDEGNLPTVSGNITYTAVYLPVVRKYDLDIVAYDCTVEDAVSGTYEYGTEFTIKVKPIFGYEFDKISDISNDVEYTDATVTFILTGDLSLLCLCKRALAPIFISPEQQVRMVYIVPAINTIVYQVEGALPTLETTMHTVDDWHFDVINTDIDTKYGLYAYYEVEQLYVNDKDGNRTRVW